MYKKWTGGIEDKRKRKFDGGSEEKLEGGIKDKIFLKLWISSIAFICKQTKHLNAGHGLWIHCYVFNSECSLFFLIFIYIYFLFVYSFICVVY